MICVKTFSSFERLREHSVALHIGSKAQPGRPKTQLSSDVQSLAPKVVLKEPLVLTELSSGLLHAQPKFGRTSKLAHIKGRPHKCLACPAAFTKLSHLKQHDRMHTGERPFLCAICDRSVLFKSLHFYRMVCIQALIAIFSCMIIFYFVIGASRPAVPLKRIVERMICQNLTNVLYVA